MWIRRVDGNVESFMGLVQRFSDKTAMTLKSTTFMACSAYAIQLNISARTKEIVDRILYMLVGFLPAYCSD